MNAKKIFYNTLIISIIVQVITGILQIGALFLNIPRLLIKQLMILDLLVQLLEGTFYGWLTYHYAKVSDITPKRYIDWMITTPTMLVTLILREHFTYYIHICMDVFFYLLKQIYLAKISKKLWLHQLHSRECFLFRDTFSTLKEED